MQDDFLSRKPFLDLLKSIIANQCDNPSGYSFAIDGEWGCGKTWVLRELEKQLTEEKDNKYLIFHYNAWENDFYDEPLVAVLSVMIEKLKTHKKTVKEKGTIGKAITSSITTLSKIVGTIIEKKYEINPNSIIDSIKDSGKAIADVKLTKSDFNKMLPLENAVKQIKSVIQDLSKEKKIILIVDELDRCLPEYAIKVLERFHHICNEMPVIQILAINKKHLAESICKVFGKDYQRLDRNSEWNTQFAESYLQKFIDVIIPLPNGKIDCRLEVLNGLEKYFKPYIRPDNIGREFIKIDDEFLGTFISALMNGVERRLQEKIFKQVALCHKLTIQSGIEYKEEQFTYAILIYEIISCICRYIFHLNETCKLSEGNEKYRLNFYQGFVRTKHPERTENKNLHVNIDTIFSCAVRYSESYRGPYRLPFEIVDTKTYIMAFFYEQKARFLDPLQNRLWDWIKEYKAFLQKYDEIMNMLVAK